MKSNLIRNSAFLLFSLITGILSSQEIESDSIVVVKSYTPSVRNAYKIKEKPSITDTVGTEKKSVSYNFFSVPVASTFSPAKGRATQVERMDRPEIFDNYFRLGFGTYTSVLAEWYSKVEISRTDNLGIFLTHNSAQGDLENILLDDHYYDSELNLNYASRQRELTWNMDFGLEHQLHNWYGVDPAIVAANPQLNPQHNFYSAFLGGELTLEDSFFDGGSTSYRFFGDDYNSAEHRFRLRPSFEVPIGGELFYTNLEVDLISGDFDRMYASQEGISYGFMNFGFDSSLLILRDDLRMNFGAALFYSLDTQNSDGNIYIYPKITASYRMAGDYFITYGGIEGGLNQNSYHQFSEENPFVAPALVVQPTDQQTNAYVGAKGKISSRVAFNLKGSYLSENYKPLFTTNPYRAMLANENYHYGNSFGVVYDKVKTVSIFGELSVDINRNFNLRINGTYLTYDTQTEIEAWNLPTFKANFMMDYQITENWFAGANAFFIGERKEQKLSAGEAEPEIVTLDPYLDLNAKIGYRFNDQLSIFAKGNNLLSESYEKWLNYPVYGLQLMAGATYKFNWGRY